MRNFEERKAEVFRRSEKRIKERKQRRKHLIMACLPLVLCITILGAFLFPGGTPGFNGTAGGGLTEEKFESLSCPIAKITITGGNFSQTYREVEDLLLISDQLYSYGSRGSETTGTADDGIASEGDDRGESADDIYGNITDNSNVAYTITLVTHEGVKTEYQLAGKTLKNLTTKQTYDLSQTQVNELYELLGIPQS